MQPALALLLATSMVAGCSSARPVESAPASVVATNLPVTVVYLVRHAEATLPPYADDPPDPHLGEPGRARANALADLLVAERIDHLFSTDYRRTQETAAPLAERLGLQVEPYDPRALDAFAARLRGTGGRHVVVGHSNTTPRLVSALGGDPGEPIDEQREFDRLYVVVIDAAGAVTTLHLRYGDPSTVAGRVAAAPGWSGSSC